MIVLELVCGAGHRFEGWFASASAYDDQLAHHLLACPHCSDKSIQRLPAGPHLQRSKVLLQPTLSAEGEFGKALDVLLQQLNAAAEDVGREFPDEARRIYYQEAPKRIIKGQASVEEAIELLEEGIGVLPLPNSPAGTKH
jgi:hypothetical protein